MSVRLRRIMSFMFLSALLVSTFAQSVIAANDALNCRLMIHQIDEAEPKVTKKGRLFRLSKQNGIATCGDGRLLQVQIMQTELHIDRVAYLSGFGVYSFESGDTLTVKFRGADESSGTVINYTIIAGSGAYDMATGSGAVRSINGPWTDTKMFELTMVVHQQ